MFNMQVHRATGIIGLCSTLAAGATCLAFATSGTRGLSEAVTPAVKQWAVEFDFDSDSCYPDAAVHPDGRMNPGLRDAGSLTGQCRDMDQFKEANTYCRSASIEKDGVRYSVYMYALFFEKDMAVAYTHIGHRFDWEYVLIWVTNDELTHASFSAHGGVQTLTREQLKESGSGGTTVRAVYHKDGVATHCFRPASRGEKPENGQHRWVTPTLVEWDLMKSDTVSNETLRKQFNEFNYGDANCSFNDKHFPQQIGKNAPGGYPGRKEWEQACRRGT